MCYDVLIIHAGLRLNAEPLKKEAGSLYIRSYIDFPSHYVGAALKSRENGWNAQTHEHAHFEVLYVTQGSLVVNHNHIDHYLERGHVYMIPPGHPHSVQTNTGHTQLGIDVCGDDTQRTLVHLLKTRVSTFTVLKHNHFLLSVPELGEMMQQFDLLNQLKVIRTLDLFLLSCMEIMESDVSFRTELTAKLEAQLSSSLSLSDIAQKMHFSQTHLERLTRKYFGSSVMELYRKMKLSKACSLLTNTGMSIGEIADTLGFCDQAYFSRFFKQRMNVSPVAYRNANKFT